jgi:hypothetical protein
VHLSEKAGVPTTKPWTRNVSEMKKIEEGYASRKRKLTIKHPLENTKMHVAFKRKVNISKDAIICRAIYDLKAL